MKRPALWAAFGALLLAIPVLISLRARAQQRELPQLGPVPAFSLTDQTGKPFTSAQLAGHVWVADFIYTSCSTMCPALSGKMAELARHVRNLGQDVHLVSFTVDPERDTVERLRGYAAGFRADPAQWTFATGSSEAVREAVVKGFHIAVDKEPSEGEADGFALVHGKSFLLVDSHGALRGIYDAGNPDDLIKLQKDVTFLVEKGWVMTGDRLAFVNACLNGSAAICLFIGWRAVKAGNRRLHGTMMATAFIISIVFLISYLTRVYLSGTHKYPGAGAWKALYLTILISHMILAVITPPLAIRTLFLAVKKRFAEHRRIVRWTLPIWMYVSVTGVLVYVLLYHPPG